MDLVAFEPLAIALGLGLLVGMQREWVAHEVAGIRTFTLITVLGVLAALLGNQYGGWVVAAGWLVVAVMILLGNLVRIKEGSPGSGVTTEMAALLMFAVGSMLVIGYRAEAVAVGGGVAVLLHWKQPLQSTVRRIGEADFKALIRLVLIGLVILPVLPNRAYGPYGVLNPFEIWRLVVLIVGISMGAYVAYKLLGGRVGTLLAGILGGLISSTATTVSYARRAKDDPAVTNMAVVVIMLASTIVFVRVMVEVAIVAPSFLIVIAPPLAIMMGLMGVMALGALFFARRSLADPSTPKAPSELRGAIVFGLLYAVVILAVAAAKEHFGENELFLVAALSGMTDLDAITLSTAQLVKTDELDADVGWRLILVGAMANLGFKGVVLGALGNRKLLFRVGLLFLVGLAGGACLLMRWSQIADSIPLSLP